MNTRQSGFFPLATTSVGRVPDQHTRRAKAKRRTRSEAESCAGGLPTENGAQGESFTFDRQNVTVGRSEVLTFFISTRVVLDSSLAAPCPGWSNKRLN